VPLVFGFEGRSLANAAVASVGHGAFPVERILGLILGGAVIAFMMELAEYALVVYTSSLTLNVCGIAKEILTLALAHQYKGDQFSALNLVGLFVCITGVSLHVCSRTRSSSSNEQKIKNEDQVELMRDCDDSESRL